MTTVPLDESTVSINFSKPDNTDLYIHTDRMHGTNRHISATDVSEDRDRWDPRDSSTKFPDFANLIINWVIAEKRPSSHGQVMEDQTSTTYNNKMVCAARTDRTRQPHLSSRPSTTMFHYYHIYVIPD
ncbi:hypothetical protein PoB_007091200 [Plakobranchus ocellatus]|uniref:Uncharacterized protein n=1 Tax=Plakobranchus ocellatus TaxID=259542 RepID=A0AAV4DK36_9GAST|nr:hypothetical protein PoB_007091200 [Plakobranchus ocellatus]